MDIVERDKLNKNWTEERSLCSNFPAPGGGWQPDNPNDLLLKKTDNTGYINSSISDSLKRILKNQLKESDDFADVINQDNEVDNMKKIHQINLVDNYKDKLDTFDINDFSTAIREELSINITNSELDSMNTIEEVTNFLDERSKNY
jgi:acyl carrier protein|tara:strand:- start:412 stop:849 length:438 start_codon:yes stop_codon:yes gene_type:complete